MASQIFLIRHGETEWSLSGRHTGRTDLPLTSEGERLARGLEARLHGIRFDHVLTSPLLRARRTCELAGLGDVAVAYTDLREWHYGDYEGRTSAEIHKEHPHWNVFEHGCPGGESVKQMARRADRVVSLLGEIEGRVAVFAHAHFLRSLAVRWIGVPLRHGLYLTLGTASVSKLAYAHPPADTPVIALWNHTGPTLGEG